MAWDHAADREALWSAVRVSADGAVFPGSSQLRNLAVMLERLRNSLIASAAGRNLAIDLIEAHGEHAADVLDYMLKDHSLAPENRRILLKAQEIMASITKRYPPTS